MRETIHKTDNVVEIADSVLTKLNRGNGTFGALLAERTVYDSLLLAVQNTVGATGEAKVGAHRFAEDMEALKHHWLLRGYFENRGYWDDADYEKELNKKVDSLKTLQRNVVSQMEELERRKASMIK